MRSRWVWLEWEHRCGAPLFIDTKYDRAFCPGCDIWTEPRCCEGDCQWFPPSPENPSDG